MFWKALARLRRITGKRWPKWLYLRYLRSKVWRKKRHKVIMRARGRCEECGALLGRRLEIHHKSYDNLGDEPLEDLRALCPHDHKVIHGKIAKR